MANKKSIQDVDADIARWLRRLNMATRKLTELHDLRRKIITGKVKRPDPPGKVTKFGKDLGIAFDLELNDSLDDMRPVGFASGFAGTE